jgi:hypothetical protein
MVKGRDTLCKDSKRMISYIICFENVFRWAPFITNISESWFGVWMAINFRTWNSRCHKQEDQCLLIEENDVLFPKGIY